MAERIDLGSISSRVVLDLTGFDNQVATVRRQLTELTKGIRVQISAEQGTGQILGALQNQVNLTRNGFSTMGTQMAGAFQLSGAAAAASARQIAGGLAGVQPAVQSAAGWWGTLRNSGQAAFTSIRQQAVTFGQSVGEVFGGVGSSIKGILSSLTSFGSLLALGAVGAGVASIVKTTMAVDSLKLALNAAAGSAQQGAVEWAWLQQVTNGLGLELLSTGESYKNILAAAVAAGRGVDFARSVFLGFGSASIALGASQEQAKRILTAVGQVMSKGKLQAEELTQQIGEAMPIATSVFAQALGVTTAKMQGLMQQGEVTRDVLLPAGEKLYMMYKDQVAEAAQMAGAQFARLENAATMAAYAMGKGGLLQAIVDVAVALTDLLKNETVIQFLISIGKAAAWSVQQIGNVMGMLGGTAAGQLDHVDAQLKKTRAELTNLQAPASAWDLWGILSPGKEDTDKLIADKQAQVAKLEATQAGLLKSMQQGPEQFPGGPKVPEQPTVTGAARGTPIQEDAEKAAKKAATEAKKKAREAAAEAKKNARELIQIEEEKIRTTIALDKQQMDIQKAQNDLEAAALGMLDNEVAKAEQSARAKVNEAAMASQLNAKELAAKQALLAMDIVKDKSDKEKLQGDIATLQLKAQELAIQENIARVMAAQNVEQARLKAAQEGLHQANSLVQGSYQTAVELQQQQNDLLIQQMERAGASDTAIQRQRAQNELGIIALKKQGLQAQAALIEAEIARTTAAGQRVDDLNGQLIGIQQEIAKLEGQRPAIEDSVQHLPSLFGQAAVAAVGQILQAFTQGSAKIADVFKAVGASFLNKGLEGLLGKGGGLSQLFGGLSENTQRWMSTAVGAAALGLSTLLNQESAKVEALGDSAKDSIEQVERTRGLIAGEQEIAIATLSQQLGAAFRPTNEILLRMELLMRMQVLGNGAAGQSTGGVTLAQAVGPELLGSARW